MKLFTKEIDKKLAAQYHLGSDLSAQVVVAKIFNPYGNGRWYLINSDPADPDYIWAIVQIGDIVEVGSVSRKELENLRVGRLRFPLERDLGFTQRNAQEVYKGVIGGNFYAKGGVADVTPNYAEGGVNEAELSKFAEALQNAEMDVYDNLDIRSGGQLYRTDSLQKQYASQMNESFKQLTKKFAHLKDINEEQAQLIHDMLEDQNYHSLNNYLALKGMYGQKRKEKYESYHTKYPDNYLNPANMSGVQSYAVGGLTPGRWYKDNEGIEYKFIGKVDSGPNKDQLLFTDGTKKTYKSIDDFGEKPKENKLFGWFGDGGKTATIGEVSSMSFKNNYDDYEMVVISKELEKDGGKLVKDRFLVSAHDIDEAKKIATDLWKKQYGQTDLSIVKVMSAEAYKHNYMGKMADGGETKKIPRYRVDIHVIGHEYDEAYSKYSDSFEEAIEFSKRGNHADIYDNEKKQYIEYKKGGYMSHGGKLNIGTIKKTDTDVYFDKKSGEFYARVIDGSGNRVNKLKINTIDDLYKDYPTFRLNEKGQKEFKHSMADGGKVKFADKVKSIQTSLLKRKKVAPSVQKDYGKTYNKAEAKEAATRIVGAMTAKEKIMAKKKMAKGGTLQDQYDKLKKIEDDARNSYYRAKDLYKWYNTIGNSYMLKWDKQVAKLKKLDGFEPNYNFGDVIA